MELYEEIMLKYLSSGRAQITLPDLKRNAKQIVCMVCYNALNRIKSIIEDENLEDSECFMKIEEIICVLEEIGSGGGLRHDFG